MSFPIESLSSDSFPALLQHIPEPPPSLNYRGSLPDSGMLLLAVVGARKYTTYGEQVVNHLVAGLRNQPVGIVSGLALGIDSLAHEAALRNNLYTLAIPGSGIDNKVIYPARHKRLARRILEAGGGLLSEYEPEFTATKWSFVKRNRIMAGITHATLIVEATERSGTLTTARMAVDYNRELLVVPGNIFSQNTAGPHQFLKLGATPVTSARDILYALGIDPKETKKNPSLFAAQPKHSPAEAQLLELLGEPVERDTLIRRSGLSSAAANALFMEMEMKGIISVENGIIRAVI